jgi:hypothetical protein
MSGEKFDNDGMIFGTRRRILKLVAATWTDMVAASFQIGRNIGN